MSHLVFLNAISTPRMPDGSRNEWKTFWGDGATELEGKNWPPLLWLALFNTADIQWARIVDDEDLDSEGRAELAEFGDTRYPYLVTSLDSALATLASRRQVILNGIGEKFAPTVDAFEALLRAKFPRFILCRTSGLADAPDAGPELEQSLTDFERLVAGETADNRIVANMADLRKQRADVQRFLLIGAQAQDLPEIPVPEEDDAVVTSTPPARSSVKRSGRRSSEWLDWGSAIVVALPAVGVYLNTRSVVLAALVFCAMCAIVVFVRVKVFR